MSPKWKKAHRLVASHFPPRTLFDEVANEQEFDILYALESLTNDRVAQEVGNISIVPPNERVFGEGTTPIMAAFTHIGVPSRFTDGQYGVYYAANNLNVAIAETQHHRAAFLAKTKEDDCEITMREYTCGIKASLNDVRSNSAIHNPDSYSYSQAFGREQRASGVNGLYFNSVRVAGGECIAVFKPKALTPVTQGCHLRYLWSGKAQAIIDVFQVKRI